MATLYKGSIAFNTPMLYGLMFLFTFTIGGLTGVFFGALSVDVHLHDTYFVVAHFHYVMMGGTIIAFIGGIHHWWPKMTGKDVQRGRGASWGALLVFVGFNMTFFNQFVMGGQGMPRRYYTYVPQFTTAARAVVGRLVHPHRRSVLDALLPAVLAAQVEQPGQPARRSVGCRLARVEDSKSPPIEHNFHGTPRVNTDPYNFPQIDRTGEVDGHH